MSLVINLKEGTKSNAECIEYLDLKHRPTFKGNYLQPAMVLRLVEMTISDKPISRNQKYKLIKLRKQVIL